jgi:hypothetical protein
VVLQPKVIGGVRHRPRKRRIWSKPFIVRTSRYRRCLGNSCGPVSRPLCLLACDANNRLNASAFSNQYRPFAFTSGNTGIRRVKRKMHGFGFHEQGKIAHSSGQINEDSSQSSLFFMLA